MALTTIDTYGIKDGAVQIDDIGTLAGNLTINDSGKLRLGTGLDLQLWHDGSHSYIDNDTGWLYVGSDNHIFQNKEFNETHARFLHDGSVELYHNNVLTFQTESDGASIIGPEGSSAFLTFKADEGDDNADLFDIGVNNGGPFSIQNKASGSWETNIECNGNGNVELYYDGNKKFETTSAGVEIDGKLTFAGDGHTKGIELGADADILLYHDNSNAYFDNNVGDFYIRNDGNSTSEKIRIQAKGGEQSITAAPNGAVELYYDNSLKLSTYSSGVSLEDHLWLKDSKELRVGDGSDLKIYHNGSHSYIWNNTGDLQLRSNSLYVCSTSGEAYLEAAVNGAISLYYDNSKKLKTESWGVRMEDELGLYDNKKLFIGTSNDLQIWHDGGAHSYIDEVANGNLVLRTNQSGTWSAIVLQAGSENSVIAYKNGGVELYYDAGKKFETISTGASITGSLGIGTSSPQRALHLSSSNTVFALTDTAASTDEKTKYILSDAGVLAFGKLNDAYDTAVEHLRITNDGNVGVGTSNPDAVLHVKKNVSTAYNAGADSAQRSGTATLNIENNDGSTNSFAQIAFDTAGSNQSIARIVALRTGTASNALTFVTENSNSKSEKLRITSNGHILLGTSTDYADANSDDLQIYGTGHTGMSITSGTSHYGSIYFGDGTSGDDRNRGIVRYGHTDDVMQFWTAATERLRIASDGNIGVGGTAPNYQFHCTSGIGIGGHGLSNQQLSLTNNAIQSLNLGVGYTALLLNKDGGNVGIGTSSPGHKLDVVGGNIRVGKTSNGQFIAENSSGAVKIKLDSSGVSYLIGGQVNIGASSPTASENGQFNCYTTTSSGKAQFVHDAGTGGLRLAGTGSGSGANLVFSNNYNSGTFSDHWTFSHNGGDDTFRVLSGGTGGTERLRIGPTGEIGVAGAGSINYGSSGQVLTSGGNSAGCQWKTPGGGKVLQVKQAHKSDHQTNSSGSEVDITGLSVSITPSSSSNKILVQYDVQWGVYGSNNNVYGAILCYRDSTQIDLGDSVGSCHRVSGMDNPGSNYATRRVGSMILDSPSTTSSVTYKMVMHCLNAHAGRTMSINRTGLTSNSDVNASFCSHITVMEVAA